MRTVLPLRHVRFFLLLLLVAGGSLPEALAQAAPFICNATARASCRALLGYVPPNATTYAAVKSLFQVRSLRSLLGDNGLSPYTNSSAAVPAGSTVRVRFPCSCSNGTGVSTRNHPVYKVKAGDGLDYIARNIFDGFVTYQEIAMANKIPDPNKIEVGQKLWIPLPCSCDPVGGVAVVHYAHLVANGSSVEAIAAEFGTDEDTLLRLNGISDPRTLRAGQVLDVPLRACSSSLSNKSADHRLLLPNNSYALTAKDCVLCSCSSSSWQLNCQTNPGISSSTCPAAKCGSLYLGNSSSVSACERTTCAYTGYTTAPNFTILTNLTTLSLCNNGSAPESQPSSSSAPGLGLQGLNWMELFISIHMALLCFGFLWRGSN